MKPKSQCHYICVVTESGNTINDTWTKPRERVEARERGGFGWCAGDWWGENADNYN